MFEATRSAGLERLETFVPNAGRAYAATRNSDLGPQERDNVSVLSPWIRHRLISEAEVVQSTLKHHAFKNSEKFIQEVFWRSYFKGWLEQRPQVWDWYGIDLKRELVLLEADPDLNSRYHDAVQGRTGIECFDHWAAELIETGYLHNHARMWFASTWIFTLRLPWVLGADFFYRHLIDGDPASNTCSWRWVAGLHTKGKHYVARASNISKFTNGRFDPSGQLNENPLPLSEDREANLVPPPVSDHLPLGKYALLITDEDCLPETHPHPHPPELVFGVSFAAFRSTLNVAEDVKQFSYGAVENAVVRAGKAYGCEAVLVEPDALSAMVQKAEVDALACAWQPVGSTRYQLNTVLAELQEKDISVHHILRRYDEMTWPHATRGFFKLKEKIPKLITQLDLG